MIGTTIALNRDVVRLWLGPALYGGQALSSLLGISAMLTLLTTAAYHVLFANGLIETTSKISLLAGVVKVLLLAILLPRLGLIAAPLTGIVAILLITGPGFVRAFTASFGSHSEPWPHLLAKVLSGPLICLTIAPFLVNAPAVSTWPGVLVKGLMLWGLLNVMLIVLLPAARTEAMRAFMSGWDRAKRLRWEYA
jgi:O-antigen/teichoic acid export membrane protein